MDYANLFSNNLPPDVESPEGIRAQTKYIFSVTNAVPETIATQGLSEGLQTAMAKEGLDLAGYPPPQGHDGLRELIAQRLKDNRGADVDVDNVMLTCGAGGAVETFLNVFIDPDDIVLVEEFSYMGTLNMLMKRKANVIHIPTDEQGMDTDALESTVKNLVAQGKHPKLIYTISVYQNPIGLTLSYERRQHMLKISHEYGIPIFENESYADFRIDGDPLPPAMIGMDDQDSVMYASSFTKLLGCGLRLGFAAFPEPMRDGLAKFNYGMRPSHLTAMAVNEYLRSHGDEHIESVRLALRSRRDAMISALGENFPPSCTWTNPEGGMMVWVNLPEGANTWNALDKAVEAGVKYNPGGMFRATRDGNNNFRLTYSHNTPEEIREGVAILADVFQREGLFGR